MSAAAAPPLRSPRASVPIPPIPGGWVPVPRILLERTGAALSKVERSVVDLVLLRTIGDEDNGRPEWAILTEGDFSRYAAATVDGIHRALVRLEQDLKVIESEPVGRRKRYRLRLDGLADVEKPARRRIARKPPQTERVVRRQTEVAADPISTEADREQAVGQATFSSIPVLEYGYCEPPKAIDLPAQDNLIPFPLREPVRELAFRNDTRTALTICAIGNGPALSIAITLAAAPSEADIDLSETKAFLMEFLPLLHSYPRDADVSKVAAARAGVVSIEQLRAYVRRRMAAGLPLTGYGIFAKLAHDCVDSAESWNAARGRAPGASPNESLSSLVLEWADQLARAGSCFDGLAGELRHIAGGVDEADPEPALTLLADVRSRMVQKAASILEQRVPELRRDVTAKLRGFRDRMTRDQFAAFERQEFERCLLNELDLPVLFSTSG